MCIKLKNIALRKNEEFEFCHSTLRTGGKLKRVVKSRPWLVRDRVGMEIDDKWANDLF